MQAQVTRPRLLVACEFSGVVRDAFVAKGWDAWSCDLLPTERPGQHYQGNVFDILYEWRWDMMIAHPPCTHLAASGARWWKYKRVEQAEAVEFVRRLMNAPILYIAIENPVGYLSTAVRKPDQIIQPWQFGNGEVKTTCLWLKNLSRLQPTDIVDGRYQRCWKEPGAKNQAKNRSRTYPGIAAAMADQWGDSWRN